MNDDNTWARHLINYYKELQPPAKLPNKVEWLYPQQNPEVISVVETFCNKFYTDSKERTVLLGINPGRFGAGITGVNFTASKELEEYCGIEHPFKKRSELSAEFIYKVINAYGGARSFYAQFFIGSVCPLGFIKEGKNINYYDDKDLVKAVQPFIIRNMERFLAYNVDRKRVICIGGEKNYKFLSALNEKHKWFKTIEIVPHPRFIMQYRRKYLGEYIDQYLEVLQKK
ncbi:MAG TPA: uracil-DNA glycosylase family protein [Flavisolibacter sp.]|nr:uracil-DNA glycosylase family protein [Flavisolibacter sp.]